MERLQGFKFELIPNGEQQRRMRQYAGNCRYVFNRALAINNEERDTAGRKSTGFFAMKRKLTEWRHDPATPWLAESPVHTTQAALKNLETGWTNYFTSLAKLKRGEIKPDQVVQPPAFKKKGQDESFRYPDPAQIKFEPDSNRIFLPKLGWLRYRNSRKPKKGRSIDRASRKPVEGELRNVTVSLKGGKSFISIQTRRQMEVSVHPSMSVAGIDVGITRFATFSDGSFIPPINSLKKHADRLKRYQRMMARRTKFGQNWKKAKAKVMRVQIHIGNVRKDFLHKESTKIAKNHRVVIVEDLKVKNMSTSAKGTVEVPGRNVKQKAGLNRAILDQGWGAFRAMLAYKLAWAGGVLVAVPPHHTSQRCPACAHVSPDNRRTQARFACVECGYENNADVVGAINVLERGYPLVSLEDTSRACGASVQEPAEGRRTLCAVQ